MKTERILVDSSQKKEQALKKAAELLRAGEVVAFPTETVYGLGANALDPAACAKIFAVKGRPADNPLIVHVASVEEAKKLVKHWPEEAERCARLFWPGPLTIVLPKVDFIPDIVSGGLDTVAVRIPSHPLALALIDAAGCPIAAPSANISGKPSPTAGEHVWQDFQGKIPLLLDAGKCQVGLESTVLDLTGEVPVILRPGGITWEQLKAALGRVDIDPALLQLQGAADHRPGPESPEGLVGSAGPEGAAGAVGRVGPAGVVGLAIPVGEAGMASPAGVAGSADSVSPTGAANPVGLASPVGAESQVSPAGPESPASAATSASAANPAGVSGPTSAADPTRPASPTRPAGPEALLDPAGQEFRPKAPGMKYRHYAPQGEVIIISGSDEEKVRRFISGLHNKKPDQRMALLCFAETAEALSQSNGFPEPPVAQADLVFLLGSREKYAEAASRLFEGLRRCDQEDIEIILAEGMTEQGIGRAYMNRLRKAAGNKKQ